MAKRSRNKYKLNKSYPFNHCLLTPIFIPVPYDNHLFILKKTKTKLCRVWTLPLLHIQSVPHFYSTDWNTKAFHCCTHVIKFIFPLEMYCLIFWTVSAVNRLQLCFCCVQSGFVAAMQLFQRDQQKSLFENDTSIIFNTVLPVLPAFPTCAAVHGRALWRQERQSREVSCRHWYIPIQFYTICVTADKDVLRREIRRI